MSAGNGIFPLRHARSRGACECSRAGAFTCTRKCSFLRSFCNGHPDNSGSVDANELGKEKGIVAKILKSDTGIGDLITKMTTAYGAVDWNKFTAAALANVTVPAEVDAAKLAAQTEYKAKVEPRAKR